MAARSRRVWRNSLTYVGSVLVVIAVLFIVNLLFFDLVTPEPSPYLGMFTFLILPVVLTLGLGLIVVGLIFARLRMKWRNGSNEEIEYYPHINLNLPGHRKVLNIIAVSILITVPFIGFMSYEGYHYTDSNEFCGQVCHKVMRSQYLAHRRSPHSRVQCATCHIGRGASWYVKSKLSGLRQVAAVVRNSYPRPIPSAIRELRPARETCERCHWPQKFYGNQLVTINHFAADEPSTPRPIQMMMKTGGNDPSVAPPSGVHWHMALGHSIEFVATDDGLQNIPWVRATDHETGAQRVFRSDGLKSADPPPDGRVWMMDCISCHNRATHIFRAPWRAADDAITADPTLRDLPFAKRELVKAVVADYASKEEGLHGVATSIEDFYLVNYPEVAATKRPQLDRLIAAGRSIYNLITYPEMNVTWRSYPDNIGHKNFPGCFRCHAGDHLDDNGRAISHRCSTCHTFLEPVKSVSADESASLIRAGEFVHPIQLEGKHAELPCSSCHDGGMAPDKSCEGCHVLQAGFRAGEVDALAAFGIEEDAMDGLVDCDECHDLSRPTEAKVIDEACFECHEEPEYEAMASQWMKEVDALFTEAAGVADPSEKTVLDLLRRIGPAHNIEASRKILTTLVANGEVAAEGE